MTLPDNRGIALFRPPFCRVAERCIPAPCICANDHDTPFREVKGRLGSHAAPLINEAFCAVNGAGLNQDNIKRLQLMTDPCKLSFDFSCRDHMTVRTIGKVELDARFEEQVKRGLVNRRGRHCPAVGCRMKVPRRIHMGAIVRGQCQLLHGPTFSIGKVGSRQAREKGRNLLPGIFMGHIRDAWPHHIRVGNHVIRDWNREINKPCGHDQHLPFRKTQGKQRM